MASPGVSRIPISQSDAGISKCGPREHRGMSERAEETPGPDSQEPQSCLRRLSKESSAAAPPPLTPHPAVLWNRPPQKSDPCWPNRGLKVADHLRDGCFCSPGLEWWSLLSFLINSRTCLVLFYLFCLVFFFHFLETVIYIWIHSKFIIYAYHKTTTKGMLMVHIEFYIFLPEQLKGVFWASEMARWLRHLLASWRLNFILRPHVVEKNHLWLPHAGYGTHMGMHTRTESYMNTRRFFKEYPRTLLGRSFNFFSIIISSSRTVLPKLMAPLLDAAS